MFQSPSSVAFSVFGVDIYFYGIFMGIAICVALLISNEIAKKFYGYSNIVLEIAPNVLLWGIIGARLYYCLINYSYYFTHPFDILAIRYGGLSIHGALLFGGSVLFFESRRVKVKFTEMLDIFAYSLPLSQAIARWGNFFNSEAFGYPTNLPWKLFIPIEYRPYEYMNSEYFHPTFLYESILDILIFIIMLFLLKSKEKIKSGKIAIVYLMLYSVVRIIVEYFRVDATMYIMGIALPILVSLFLIIMCLVLLFKD